MSLYIAAAAGTDAPLQTLKMNPVHFVTNWMVKVTPCNFQGSV